MNTNLSLDPAATTSATTAASAADTRYRAPGWFTRSVFNRAVAGLTKAGVSVWGSRVLEVRGRTSGQLRRTPVNVLTIGHERYLVAPRGVTEWVRNVRAAGGCALRLGRRTEPIAVVELADTDKPAVLRAYLRRWRWEVGQFFDGVGPDATDEQLLAVASGYPVFRLAAR